MYNYYGDNMKLFSSKQKINSYTMKKLIYETSLNNSNGMYELLDKTGIIYNREEVKLNILALNVELCRYSLYKSNKKDVVDSVINNVYKDFFYNLLVSEEEKMRYRRIIDSVSMKLRTIFTNKKLLAPKDEFIFRLFLENLRINEDSIERMYLREFYGFAAFWINTADGINTSYQIEDTEADKKKNETIDFRF